MATFVDVLSGKSHKIGRIAKCWRKKPQNGGFLKARAKSPSL
jgi:hypothetical protein